jgi:acetyl-CoA carboxylase biotin carboxyl carrier protein
MPNVSAHITGTVVRIEKGPGEPVGAGEAILILESMKMEMPLESPVDGRVKEVRVKEGQAVAEGDILAVVE